MGEKMKPSSRRSIILAMYAAIICAGCFIAIPLGPIPLVLQNMLAVMAGALFGVPQGPASVGLFLIAGVLGIPVFSGGKGGMAVLAGPTGGFLVGYFIGALICGFIAKRPAPDERPLEKTKLLRLFTAGLAGFIAIYATGLAHYTRSAGVSFSSAMATCVIPFLPGDLIKLLVMVPLASKLRPVAARLMYKDDASEQG